jgi:general secretion pathway protein D
MRRFANLFVCGASFVLFLVVPGMAVAAEPVDGDGVMLNFANADIDSVVRAVAKITNRNYLVDPRVKGTLNIVTTKPVSPATAHDILRSALRLQGFAIIDENGILKVVPEADAKQHSIPVSRAKSALRGDQLITQVFTIKNESATQLLQVVRPLVTANNAVTASAASNTLVVTDYAENVGRIARIIDAIDVPQGDVAVIQLKHASAMDLASTISRLMGDGGAAGDQSQRVTVVPDTRANVLLVRSDNPARINAARQLVASLDQPGAAGNIHVIYLKNADATKVAQTLRDVLSGESSSGSSGRTTASSGGTSSPTGLSSTSTGSTPTAANSSFQPQSAQSTASTGGGGIVHADRSTNSLIITAPEAIYNNIRQVVDMLDRRRAQVFVEALVAEITTDRAAEFGIQWQSMKPGDGGSASAFGGTNFGSKTNGTNILGLALNPASAAAGLNLIVGKGSITLPGSDTPILNLSVLARFLESQTNTNILSTPNLIMLDNEEAKIVVGQNLPFITGQYTNTGSGTTSVNPFQTIERRDVGLTMRIRPQISEGGAVVMQIVQESSSVVATSLTNSSGPTTNKRSIETTAVVDDGAIIALGGLVQDSYTSGVDKVPLLGDIPVLGNLFKYDSRQRSKTNLFVFLRPKILREGESYRDLVADRYDYVIGQQRGVDRPGRLMRNEAPAPELPPRQPEVDTGTPVQ